jgi:hypothetical protein
MLFPNTQGLGPEPFRDLRAMGTFLLSASYDGKAVPDVTLFSEKGAAAKLVNPGGRPAGLTCGLSDDTFLAIPRPALELPRVSVS